MDIREAIEKAGPGGKIKRRVWTDNIIIIVGEVDELLGTGLRFYFEDLTATDWTVVTEEIEVGDVVHMLRGTADAMVLGEDSPRVAIQFPDKEIRLVHKADLTLIRKGPKKATETFKIGARFGTEAHRLWDRLPDSNENRVAIVELTEE